MITAIPANKANTGGVKIRDKEQQLTTQQLLKCRANPNVEVRVEGLQAQNEWVKLTEWELFRVASSKTGNVADVFARPIRADVGDQSLEHFFVAPQS